MSYFVVFACGLLVGRTWPSVKHAVVPMIDSASRRFDALYANAARSVAQTVEDVEDRAAERRHRAGSQLLN